VTLLFAVFAFCSFISSPFLGALSDKIGRKPILIISIISTAVGWLVFASAKSMFFLFIGRIIDGMAAGNISIAQSSMVDIAKEHKERTQNIGMIGAAVGIGFVIGPLIGGLLSSFSTSVPFWFATALAFIDVIFAIIFLEETHKNPDKKAKLEYNPLLPIKRAIRNKAILPGLYAWFFFIMAVSATQAIFALYLDSAFGIGALGAGLLFAIMGSVIAFNQIVALKHFWLKYFSEPKIEFWMILVSALGFFIMGMKFIVFFIIGLVIAAFGQSVLRAVMISQIVSKSAKESRGEVIGITTSVLSIGMTISPVIAGAIFGVNISYPFMLSGVFLLIAFGIICVSRKNEKKEIIIEDIIPIDG
jgi:DHA1 family tetracycline resistance protein-like MFS transporter